MSKNTEKNCGNCANNEDGMCRVFIKWVQEYMSCKKDYVPK